MKKCRFTVFLAAVLCAVLSCGPAYANTKSAGDGYLIADDLYKMADYSGPYRMSDGSSLEIVWLKEDPGNVGFAGKDLESGERPLIIPMGYHMTYWFVIDNGLMEVKTKSQPVAPLYIEYKNENATGPMNQYLYRKNTDSAANTICYDLPQGYDYSKFGNYIISVKRVTKLTFDGSEAVYEVEEPESYLTSADGKTAILDQSPSEQIYRIEKGDTLRQLADRIYGDPDKWSILYRRNRSVIRSADRIYAGQMIVLPKM